MTPKEKAGELYRKFDEQLPCEGLTTGQTPVALSLILVEEILKLDLKIGQHLEEFKDKTDYYSYWEEVKEEIEKL